MHRLVLATDLSARCHWALERSLLLACEFGAPLTILLVVDEDLPPGIAAHHRQADRAIRDRVEALPAHKGIDLTIRVVLGRAAPEILRFAEEEGGGLIVLGGPREERCACSAAQRCRSWSRRGRSRGPTAG